MIAILGLIIGSTILLVVKDPPRVKKLATVEENKIKSKPLKEFF